MLSRFRDYFVPLRKLLAWPFLKMGVSPNTISLLGVLLAIMAAVSLRLGQLYLPFCLAFLALLTDLIDGEVARTQKKASPWGNYFDAVGDRLRECLLLFGLLPNAPDVAALALIGTCLTSFAKARVGLVVRTDNRDWPYPGDHPDRAALILSAYFFQAHSVAILCLLVLLSWSCFFQRLRYARTLVDEAHEEDLLPYLK